MAAASLGAPFSVSSAERREPSAPVIRRREAGDRDAGSGVVFGGTLPFEVSQQ